MASKSLQQQIDALHVREMVRADRLDDALPEATGLPACDAFEDCLHYKALSAGATCPAAGCAKKKRHRL